MASSARVLAVLALLSTSATLASAASGAGVTTRYWDCCKPSCAWNDLSTLGIDTPVAACGLDQQPIADSSAASGCGSTGDNTYGPAYMCADQTPWAVSATLAYGFAAVTSADPNCCQCYKLTFTSGSLQQHNKVMIVQATNTGDDVGPSQFDLAMPGGGFGRFDGCGRQWGATDDVWGEQRYGGASSNTCANFPPALNTGLNSGCGFRWDWFEGDSNPTVNWEMVACPAALTTRSGCVRTGDNPYGPASVPTWTSGAASPTAPPAASSPPVLPTTPAASSPPAPGPATPSPSPSPSPSPAASSPAGSSAVVPAPPAPVNTSPSAFATPVIAPSPSAVVTLSTVTRPADPPAASTTASSAPAAASQAGEGVCWRVPARA